MDYKIPVDFIKVPIDIRLPEDPIIIIGIPANPY